MVVAECGQQAVWCFFRAEGRLYQSWLRGDGLTWEPPQEMPEWTRAVTGLKVAYSPHHAPLLYGHHPESSMFFVLGMPPQHRHFSPYIPVPADARVAVASRPTGGGARGPARVMCLSRYEDPDGRRHAKLRVVSALIDVAHETSKLDYDLGAGVAQVLVADASTSGAFALVRTEDGALHRCTFDAEGRLAENITIGALPFRADAVHMTGTSAWDASWDLYGIDEHNTLRVMREDRRTEREASGNPRWLAPLPIADGVGGISVSHAPDGGTAVFSHGVDGGHLRLDVQDPATGMWQETDVRVPGIRAADGKPPHGVAHEVTRHRLEAQLTDDRGAVLAHHPVTLRTAASSAACRVTLGGRSVLLNSEPLSLRTDAMGRLTIALPADGLAAPQLLLEAAELAEPVQLQPGHSVHAYLAGRREQLNPTNPGGGLGPFDAEGGALRSATVDHGDGRRLSLIPGHRQGEDLAAVAKTVRAAAAGIGAPIPDAEGAAGFAYRAPTTTGAGATFSAQVPSPATFTLLHTSEDIRQYQQLTGEPEYYSILDDAWDWLRNTAVEGWHAAEQLAGDLWQAVKSGAVAVEHVVVDAAGKVATFTLRIGETLVNGVKLVVHALQQAANFVVGVLRAIEAALEDVIRWLRALFDFGAIWNTKKALEQSVQGFLPMLGRGVQHARGAADRWLEQQQAGLDTTFARLREECGAMPIGSPVPGAERDQHPDTSPAHSGDVHRNWAMDKVQTYAPDLAGTGGESDGIAEILAQLGKELATAWEQFGDGASELAGGLWDLLRDGGSTRGIGELIDAVRDFAKASLTVAKAFLDGLAALVTASLDGVQALLTSELDLGPLNTLWSWLARAAGHPEDTTLTVGGVIALLAAVPVTIGYKIAHGAEKEPFPGDVLP
ncbi:hypothetical protein ACIRVF_22055 [Kitasatospora sp. NPDC101157]|uniref:hypothetical protein n=1 Tax=Kitasatospora sp. NPDC101157 TaxID=3364098 RepID=UPI0037FB97E7